MTPITRDEIRSEEELKEFLLQNDQDNHRIKKPTYKGRRSKERAIKDARDFLATQHPELMAIMVGIAKGNATDVSCPQCGHKFKAHTLKGADREMLIHLDNRVQGKTTTVIDAIVSVELTNAQLGEVWRKAAGSNTLYEEIRNIQIIEAEVTEIPIDVKEQLLLKESDEKRPPIIIPDMMSTPIIAPTITEDIDKIEQELEDGYVEVSRN